MQLMQKGYGRGIRITYDMAAYYNEWDKDAAALLRQLIADGHIAPGEVDTRDIREVTADDIREFTQHHFFAGGGGWSLALRRAGWPDNRPIRTVSCPCQPYSGAGEGSAQSDERHLWPDFRRLNRESSPIPIVGEQVEDAIAYGWLDDAFADLEADGYACAASVLPSYSAGGSHERFRIFFLANPNRERPQGGELWMQENKEQGNFHAEVFPPLLVRGQPPQNDISPPPISVSNDGIPRRVVRSGAKIFGNAIDVRPATQFLLAAAECIG